MSRVVREATVPALAESELARLIAAEERLSAATREARRAAAERIDAARAEAAVSAEQEARAVEAAIASLRERVLGEVERARTEAESERTRRLGLYRSVAAERLRSLADSVLASLAGD